MLQGRPGPGSLSVFSYVLYGLELRPRLNVNRFRGIRRNSQKPELNLVNMNVVKKSMHFPSRNKTFMHFAGRGEALDLINILPVVFKILG